MVPDIEIGKVLSLMLIIENFAFLLTCLDFT